MKKIPCQYVDESDIICGRVAVQFVMPDKSVPEEVHAYCLEHRYHDVYFQYITLLSEEEYEIAKVHES